MDVRQWVDAWVWGVPGVTPAQVGASAALLTIDEWVEVLGAVDGVRAHRVSALQPRLPWRCALFVITQLLLPLSFQLLLVGLFPFTAVRPSTNRLAARPTCSLAACHHVDVKTARHERGGAASEPQRSAPCIELLTQRSSNAAAARCP